MPVLFLSYMNTYSTYHKIKKIIIISGFFFLSLIDFPGTALSASHPVLKKYIIEYNLKTLENSLADGSYRGEEGILRVRPEIAGSLGIKAFIDDDYTDSLRLFKEADEALKEAKNMMRTRKKEKDHGYYAERIADNFLLYKKSLEEAGKKMAAYRSRLKPETDKRFDKAICEKFIDKKLDESLQKTNSRLRDGLAYFYNICQGIEYELFPLTTKNVSFVNYVFNGFLGDAAEDKIKMFDLDRNTVPMDKPLTDDWIETLGYNVSRFSNILETAIKKTGDTIYNVDPLLFIALMRKESGFNPLAVSGLGAAGLTQIMPETAKDLGLKNIFMPDYYNEAGNLLKKEREIRSQAIDELFKISENNKIEYAKQARKLMQASLDISLKREKLFTRYKEELLKNQTDDRLQPEIAIEFGLAYFASLLKAQKGDISLALASYNAGPHRVMNYRGIPPYSETIRFRNSILHYYREYLNKIRNR